MCFKGETATFIKHFFVIFFGFHVDGGIFGTGKHSPSVSDRDVHIKRIMEKHTMKKSYEKNELTFALVWIVIYCVLQSQSTFC